jgi:DNA repair exonuclease SbcCD ATPase subunit
MARSRKKETKSPILTRLFIKNFQPYKRTKFKFHPGVNVIIGSSHFGKSSIMRAIRKAVFNRPRGGKFYSNFAPKKGKTVIKLDFSDGVSIKNVISISKKKKDDKTVKKVNSQSYSISVGETTKRFSGLSDEVISGFDLGEINFQGQHDPPLLLSTSKFKLAKLVSDITKLDKAYEAQSTLQGRVAKGKTQKEVVQTTVNRLKKELKRFDKLDELESTIQTLGIKEQQREQLVSEIQQLTEARQVLRSINKQISNVKSVLKKTEVTEKQTSFWITKRESLVKEIQDLKSAYSTIKKIKSTEVKFKKAEQDYFHTLKDLRQCPTCGQDTTGL